MKFKKLWLTLFCFSLLLSACGKENDEKVIVTSNPNNVSDNLEHKDDELSEGFIKETGVTLTGKEVQFDLANNLDKEFYLDGEVNLCNYYNYGFTNESKFFCGQLTPTGGNYSDSWYLYFHRDTFNNEYQALLAGNVNMRIIAEIPSKAYKRGQGNMAGVKKLQSY